MQEFSVTDTALHEILAVVARGESVRLVDAGKEIAVVTPGDDQPEGGEPFADRIERFRDRYEVEQNGITTEEIASWRDNSKGPEATEFE